MNTEQKKGLVYLIPITISENTQDRYISEYTRELIKTLDHFAVENIRTARRFISSLRLGVEIETLSFSVLDKNSSYQDIDTIIGQLMSGHSYGVMSESGSPGIADPGSLLVEAAHRNKIRVQPVPGPSSILLALMASGFSGQRFRFVGYLPVEKRELRSALKELEKRSSEDNESQILIETPYRNDRLLQFMISILSPKTHLCIAADVTGENESIKSKSIQEWKRESAEIGKIPAVFLIYSGKVL